MKDPYRGLLNFRDAGGHPTVDGSRVRTGLLYRSGRFECARPEDDRHLAEALGIRSIVDLRTAHERDAAGPAALYSTHPQVREVQLPFFERGRGREMPVGYRPVDWAQRYLSLTIDQGRFQLARLVDLLADEDNLPAVLHCWSGKDRTGIAIAVLQEILGVDDTTIGADYAATGTWFAAHLDDHPDLQVAGSRQAYDPQAETMLLTIDGLRTQFGSIEAMLVESGAGSIHRFRELLLDAG